MIDGDVLPTAQPAKFWMGRVSLNEVEGNVVKNVGKRRVLAFRSLSLVYICPKIPDDRRFCCFPTVPDFACMSGKSSIIAEIWDASGKYKRSRKSFGTVGKQRTHRVTQVYSSCYNPPLNVIYVKKHFNLPVLSRLTLNESMRTGNSTPRAKENPSVRIMHIVEQKQINHDQILSCLKEETSPQKRPMIAIPRLYFT